MGMYAVAEGY